MVSIVWTASEPEAEAAVIFVEFRDFSSTISCNKISGRKTRETEHNLDAYDLIGNAAILGVYISR